MFVYIVCAGATSPFMNLIMYGFVTHVSVIHTYVQKHMFRNIDMKYMYICIHIHAYTRTLYTLTVIQRAYTSCIASFSAHFAHTNT